MTIELGDLAPAVAAAPSPPPKEERVGVRRLLGFMGRAVYNYPSESK
jgi:hypothetical protein